MQCDQRLTGGISVADAAVERVPTSVRLLAGRKRARGLVYVAPSAPAHDKPNSCQARSSVVRGGCEVSQLRARTIRACTSAFWLGWL